MANLLTAVQKQHWEGKVQDNLEKDILAMELCDMVDIPNGTTKNLPYINRLRPTNYTKYTDVTSKDIKTGNDQLIITETPMVPFDIDELDFEDNYINIQKEVVDDAGYMLKSAVDGDILNEALQANHLYDNRGLDVIGGTPTPIALTTGTGTNIPTVLGGSRAVLTNGGVSAKRLALVIDSFVKNDINTVGIQNGFNVADESIQRGYRGMFLDMSLYETGNLTSTVTFDMTTNATAGEFISIAGNVFTFVSTLGTTAGNVLIGGSASATLANLASAINGGAGAGTTYISVDDDSTLYGISATASTATITITSKRGRVFPSSSNNGTNDFQAETLHCMIMEKKAIKLSIRDSVRLEERKVGKNLVTTFLIWSRYGKKTPTRGKARMVRIAIQATPAEA